MQNNTDYDDEDEISREVLLQNLKKIGAISLQEYFCEDNNIPELTQISSPPSAAMSAERPTEVANHNSIARLHQACQKAFGNSNALKYEFIQDDGPQSSTISL